MSMMLKLCDLSFLHSRRKGWHKAQTSGLHTLEGRSWHSKMRIPNLAWVGIEWIAILAFGPGELVDWCALLTSSLAVRSHSMTVIQSGKLLTKAACALHRSPVGISHWTKLIRCHDWPVKSLQELYWERPSKIDEPVRVTGIMSTGNVKVAVSTIYCSFESLMSWRRPRSDWGIGLDLRSWRSFNAGAWLEGKYWSDCEYNWQDLMDSWVSFESTIPGEYRDSI